MLTIKEVIKTINNAFNQKLKKHRGNWDQNDPTAEDYIKNRPFYTNGYTTIIKNKTFRTYNDYEFCSPFVFEITEGEVYKVVWNGKEYECVVYTEPEGLYIGNSRIMGGNNDTGEPFFYAYTDYGDGNIEYFWCIENAGAHTVSIHKSNVVKIDKKYLPANNNAEVEAAIDDLYDYADYLDSSIANIPTDVVRFNTNQNLTLTQKKQARKNIETVAFDYSQNITELSWDGNTNGLDSLVFNAFSYYRVSEAIPSFSVAKRAQVISNYSNDIYNYYELPFEGLNCYSLGSAIVVTKSGYCTLKVNQEDSYSQSFTAPSTGIYFQKVRSDRYCSKISFNAETDFKTMLPANQSGIEVPIMINENGTFFEEHFPNTIARSSDIHTKEVYKQELGATYTWDGVTDGLDQRNLSVGTFFKISDYIPTKEEMNEAFYIYESQDGEHHNLIQRTVSSALHDRDESIYDNNILVGYNVYKGLWFRRSFTDSKHYNFIASLTLNGKIIELTAPLSDQYLPSTVPVLPTAQIGQTITIKSIDENGKPTEWETVDLHTLTDTETGKKYQLSVVNGKLTMTEVE